MKYLLDTNIISVWARRRNPALNARILGTPLADFATSAIVRHEITYGLLRNPAVKSREALELFLGELPLLPVDTAVAQTAAEVRHHLARSGSLIGPFDLLIAATALTHKLTLVTHNVSEFGRVPLLTVEDWLSDS